MPRYTHERKTAVLNKLLPPNNASVVEVSLSEGINQSTLYTWLNKAREQGTPVPGSKAHHAEQWSGETKLAVVLETQPMNDAEKAAYCREKGLYIEQIDRWRQAMIAGASDRPQDNEPLRTARNEIKRLKRKVDRKDKALAESAALLVLSKKFQALWEDEE